MKHFRIALFVFLLGAFKMFPQKTLQVFTEHFGKTKRYIFYNNEVLQYKLKGDWFYHKDKIVNLQDSSLIFSNDSIITLKDLKAIRFQRGGHLAKTFQEAFLIGGIGFISLNTINNVIYSREPVIDNKAIYIGSALIGASILMKMICTKHIRIHRNTVLKINTTNYEDLNKKD
jgi:hypothetical protein